MAEFTALQKHSCPACGAQAEWHPRSQRLVCPYCGTQSPYEIDSATGEIRELDLVRALRDLPEELRGWKTAKRSVRCRSCNAISVFDPELVGRNCEFCGSPELVDYEELKAPIRPQSLLPFRVGESEVRERLRGWFRSRWFAPGTLKTRALVDGVRGLYLPYWTFDARVHARWTAESGYYYYTSEQFTDSDGRQKTRQVRHTRWQPSAGELTHFFDDEPIPGSRGMDSGLLRGIEPFPTVDLVPYDTAYLSGFVVEHYQVVLLDAAREGREAMERKLRQMCAAEVPGDTFRNLHVYPDFSEQTFKHILVPVWLLTYNFRKRTFRIAVNGYTGALSGDYPKSFWKIFFLVVALLMIVTLVVLFL